MILEKSDFNLIKEGETEKKNYLLGGTFTQFGVKNNNGRIYEEAEFMPHLEYLQKKIKRGLLGELDHPEKFETSLNKASHVIENITYDKDSRQLVGKIRLLNTDPGRNAKALVDDDIQLSISSRAAGVVRENGTVQIKKVFTYDLVADPGFENANLERINECLGYDYGQPKLKKINESFGYDADDANMAIYEMDITEEELDSKIEYIISENAVESNQKNIKENNTNKSMENFVSVEAFNEYTTHLKKEVDRLEESINSKDDIILSLKAKLNKYENYLDHVVEETNKYIEYSDTSFGEVNNILEYVECIANEGNNILGFANYLSESLNKIKEYSEYQTQMSNALGGYVHYLANHIDENIEQSNNLIMYSEYLSELVDRGLQFSDNLGNEIQILSAHNTHIAEGVNYSIGFVDYLREKLNVSINYQNYMAEELNMKEGVLESGSYLGINENRNETEILVDNATKVENKLNKLIESAEKQKAESNQINSDQMYFKLLNENKKKEFLLLTESQKQKVMYAVRQKKPITEGEFISIWESAISGPTLEQHTATLLESMPEEYKGVWEQLKENDKNAIIASSRYININNSYAVKDFWQTRRILNERLEFQPLNESEQLLETQRNQKLGYSNNYLNAIEKALDKNKR